MIKIFLTLALITNIASFKASDNLIFLGLFSLLSLGGIAVKYFAIAMIIGVLVGTYSSIYIAGASLFFLKVLENKEERD